MSAGDADANRDWWTRPRIVLPLAAALVLAVAILTPQSSSGRFGDPRVSSRLSGSMGAKILAETARRLGWRVGERTESGVPAVRRGATIHAILAPVVPVTPSEAHAYLEAVRGGDALLFAVAGRSPLGDSLGVWHLPRGATYRARNVTRRCRARREVTPPLWADGQVHLFGVRWLRAMPAGATMFGPLTVADPGDPDPGFAAAGFPYGAGRVVVIADPDLVRNDALRFCRWNLDVIGVQLLEYLRAGGNEPRTTLTFDEYHQGYGIHPSAANTIMAFLVVHPAGRITLQLVLAGLVLLLATAPRALPPQDDPVVERRDPLEQVDALAHAYEQVAATRTASARLLRGMRRRLQRGVTSTRHRPDDAFLTDVAARAPALASDVATVRHALAAPVSANEFSAVGAALERIEHTLTTRTT